jgi:hypothetical protein
MLPPSSGRSPWWWRQQALRSVNLCQTTRRKNPEYSHLHQNKSCASVLVFATDRNFDAQAYIQKMLKPLWRLSDGRTDSYRHSTEVTVNQLLHAVLCRLKERQESEGPGGTFLSRQEKRSVFQNKFHRHPENVISLPPKEASSSI